jgi:HAD superfamily hydrolase (TIGR01509 family)
MTTKIDAVIFDCDGTLVDSETVGFTAILAEAKKLGIVFAPDEDLLDLKGQAMALTMAGLEKRLGRPLPGDYEATLRAAMAAAFRERLQVVPGARETITGMKRPYCIASNGPRAKMDLTLELTGLMPFFEGRIFSAYEVGSFKPDPGLFLHAAAALGVAPARCAVVEDSITGIAAGLAAGMTVYAVHAPQALPAGMAARVHRLAHLADLCAAPWNQ